MNHDFRKTLSRGAASRLDEGAAFDDLLHPARAIARPSDVVDDHDLTLMSLEPKLVRATELKPLISLTLISLIGTGLPQMGSEVWAQKAMNNRSQGRMLPEHANC